MPETGTGADWKPKGKYAMVNGHWSVAKYQLGEGRVKYGLWYGEEVTARGYFNSFEEAKEKAK